MIKYFSLAVILSLRLVYQPGTTNSSAFAPVENKLAAFRTGIFPARLVHFKGELKKNKIFLRWEVAENETADQFEVEKSVDGKNFMVAALVFGSDNPQNGVYEFYEKAGNRKIAYRIKLKSKNNETEYSPVVEFDPAKS